MHATSCPTIQIVPAQHSLPRCSPNLMPFHLNYSGIASISTYFRVKPATLRQPEANAAQLSTETDLETKKADIDTVETTAKSGRVGENDTDVAMDVTHPTDDIVAQPQKKSSLGARFVAAFRGRTVHGVTVDLPDGYSGIVLRAAGDGSGKGKTAVSGKVQEEASSKSKKGRLTRKASRMDVDEDVDVDMGEGASQEGERGPVRTLNPTACFSSFVLWNPDRPVDEARDEYLRSLNEWTRLAEEIHRFEN